ncbi:MAG: hypothetical protein LUQ31_02380 [Methanoregula sp.]|nr:hypothetical protein [Methanoregula sp.]
MKHPGWNHPIAGTPSAYISITERIVSSQNDVTVTCWREKATKPRGIAGHPFRGSLCPYR